ncbi:MAG: 2-oxo acid dehydrogenase subunit E2 [Deltaproteobacteria bacterium]|nr:MAG: 2-oxo acid dehydrogenase subunit E2 [Deltaproteobacteria bacterium]
MATKIIMPQGGQDITEGTVVSWLKSEGDPVKKGEVICEVETEKAVFEVESPVDGVLLKIVALEGEKVPIFSVIGVVGEAGEEIDYDQLLAEEKREEAGVDVSKIRKRLEARGKDEKGDTKVSGRAKKLAETKAVDLSQVEGTGPHGRIREKDILAYIEQKKISPLLSKSQKDRPIDERGKTVPMSKMRRVIARRMQQSKQSAPHFYVTVSVAMTEALKLCDEFNQLDEGTISINDMITKAAALALEEFYQINSVIEGDHIVYLNDINIGIAVSLDEGLIVPVLPQVDKLSLKEIALATKRLVSSAKSGKQATLTPGTFTISNMGMMNIENFVAIINPPESAILAIGTIEKKVVVSNDNDLRIRDVMKMTLSIDHRVIDGATASKFINKIKYHLQHPKTLIS